MANKNPKFNASGCPDPTAYEAMKPIIREENEIGGKANFLIKILKFIISESGFELLNRIELRHSKSGKEFK